MLQHQYQFHSRCPHASAGNRDVIRHIALLVYGLSYLEGHGTALQAQMLPSHMIIFFDVVRSARDISRVGQKLHPFFIAITLSTENKLSEFWHIQTVGDLQLDDVGLYLAHATRFV